MTDEKFRDDLAAVLEKHGKDAYLGMPAVMLGAYLDQCLLTLSLTIDDHERHHGRADSAAREGAREKGR